MFKRVESNQISSLKPLDLPARPLYYPSSQLQSEEVLVCEVRKKDGKVAHYSCQDMQDMWSAYAGFFRGEADKISWHKGKLKEAA